MDRNQTMVVGVVALLLVFGLFFLIRGVMVGQAIHFQSPQELNVAVQDLLERFAEKNEFSSLLPPARICFEVWDLNISASYVLEKTAEGHTVTAAPLPCSSDVGYEGSLQFTNWNTFNVVVRKPSCESFILQHRQKNFYVLPSQYVLPTFKRNPFVDYAAFCPLLRSCVPPGTLDDICPPAFK